MILNVTFCCNITIATELEVFRFPWAGPGSLCDHIICLEGWRKSASVLLSEILCQNIVFVILLDQQ